MKTLYRLLISLIVLTTSLGAETKVLSVDDVIQRIEEVDPAIAASRFKTLAAKASTEKSKSAYYPKVDLQSLIPVPGGMPGSYGEIGVRGVMVSPFHTGNSIGLLASYTLFDFGRTKNAVKSAEQDEISKKEEAKITRINTVQNTLHVYYDCIKYKSLADTWTEKLKRLKFLQGEVGKFVSTGQRSIVDTYLMKSHVEKIQTQLKVFEENLESSEQNLSLLLEIPREQLVLPELEKLHEAADQEEVDISNSPFVKKAESDLLVSKSKLDVAKAGAMPEIKSMGSVGDFDQGRTAPKQNWAVGFGINVPIFEGFKVKKDIEEAEALMSEKQKELEATRKHILETNIKLNKAIENSRIQITHLTEELKIAEEGYRAANGRYANFQGTLLDLRETIINLYRVKSEMIDAKVRLSLYQNVHNLVNGIL
ncbi:MAG: TolC family protein [Leptospiraceae bacterium]|nr:TolC family protein [Leptospiraceae bacterium]